MILARGAIGRTRLTEMMAADQISVVLDGRLSVCGASSGLTAKARKTVHIPNDRGAMVRLHGQSAFTVFATSPLRQEALEY
jgi:ethanolamine utilization protein EutQ (cupin superfamily)